MRAVIMRDNQLRLDDFPTPMRAVIMRDNQLRLDDFPTPTPSAGEVLVKVKACGICGSDLHALKHGEEFVQQSQKGGALGLDMDTSRDVVMGHEYCGEIVEFGPDCLKTLQLGQDVCSIPALRKHNGIQTIGYSNDYPGGYGEYLCLTEAYLEPVNNGLSPILAALTEPMAVGLHAVRKARLEKNDVPLVIGCGPVGLAVIASLKQLGVHPIVAADFSATRREFALLTNPNRSRPPWMGPKYRPAVIFECVGVPGVIDNIMENAVHGARIVVVGVCMQSDHYHPVYGINKELNLQFVVAYNRQEFAESLHLIAEGKLSVEPLITAKISLSKVSNAFEELASPDKHAKIIVEPTTSI